MSRIFRGLAVLSLLRYKGNVETINSQSIRVYAKDENGKVVFCSGTVTITDTGSGYAKGCLYIKTDVGGGSSGVYENVGTTSSCNFDLFGSAAAGPTTLTGLTDTPATYAAQANKIVKVNAGETAVEFVTVSGDVAMSAGGAFTVTGITLGSDAQGDIYYRGAAALARLGAGTNGYILQTKGAGANPQWVDPTTLPNGVATGLASSFTMEGGASDITVSVTTQTVGACALTIPDFASVADTFVFATLAQTLANKTLTTPTLTTPLIDDGDAGCTVTSANQTHASATATIPDFVGAADEFVMKALAQTLTNKTLTSPQIASFTPDGIETLTCPVATDTLVGKATTDTLTNKTLDAPVMSTISVGGQTVTLPTATDTLVGKATTDTLTNKTLDANGTGNVISNLNVSENEAVTLPTATDASDAVYVSDGLIVAKISNQAAAVNIYNTNAPFKFMVVDAWSQNLSADGGTWKLDNGANDLHSAVTVAASDDDIDRVVDLDDDYQTIASGGSLRIVPDGGGSLDAYIFIKIIRLA